MKPLVSVIIPVFNSEQYLRETLLSVMNQTYRPIEIIVVDDGSEDRSLVVAEAFESSGVRVFHQQNKGASAARNKGLQEAKGEFIQFLDGDDLLSAGKISEQMNLLQKKQDHISICPTVHFYDGEIPCKKEVVHNWMSADSGEPVGFLTRLYGGGLIDHRYGGMVTVHAWLCPRAVLDKAGPWNEAISVDDDGEYFCRVVLAAKGIIYAHGAVNYYRKYIRGTNLSASRSRGSYQSVLTAIDAKFTGLYAAANDKEMIKKIFARLYNDFAVSAYPGYSGLAEQAAEKSEKLISFKAGLPGRPGQQPADKNSGVAAGADH